MKEGQIIVWSKYENGFTSSVFRFVKGEFKNVTGMFPYGFRIVKLK